MPSRESGWRRKSDRTFLDPLLTIRTATYGVRNERTGAWLARSLETAVDSATRRRGLLGRHMIDTDAALVIAPCAAIHTCFMRFPIDALFVSRSGRVLKVCHDVFPWRIAVAWGAFAVVEFAAGTLRRSKIVAGDRVVVAPIASMARLSELRLTDGALETRRPLSVRIGLLHQDG